MKKGEMRNVIAKMLGVTPKSYYNYKKQKRPIIMFLEKYFTSDELKCFLETSKLPRLEGVPNEKVQALMALKRLILDIDRFIKKEQLERVEFLTLFYSHLITGHAEEEVLRLHGDFLSIESTNLISEDKEFVKIAILDEIRRGNQ